MGAPPEGLVLPCGTVPRIPLITSEPLTAEQRPVYDRIVSGPRGAVTGPLPAVLHSPELAEHFQALGALLRYGTTIPQLEKEIAILVTARRWESTLEWYIHEGEARKAGVPEAVIAAIEQGTAPAFTHPAQAEVYEFARELQHTGFVSEARYRAVLERYGALGAVELTAVLGYYTMVAMTLNAHEIVPPHGLG